MNLTDFILTFMEQESIGIQELKEYGYNYYHIFKLRERGILARISQGKYKLVSNLLYNDWLRYGIYYENTKQYEEAILCYLSAMDLEKSAYCCLRIAGCYIKQKDYDKAYNALKRMFDLEFKDSKALYARENYYVLTKLLKNFTEVEEIDVKLVNNEVKRNRIISKENFLFSLAEIDRNNYFSALNKLRASQRYSMSNAYVSSLVEEMLQDLITKTQEELNEFTPEGINHFKEVVKNLTNQLEICLAQKNHNDALIIVDKIININKKIKPLSNDRYCFVKDIILEINALKNNEESTATDYQIKDDVFNDNRFLHYRYLQEKNYSQAYKYFCHLSTSNKNHEVNQIIGELLEQLNSLQKEDYKYLDNDLLDYIAKENTEEIYNYVRNMDLSMFEENLAFLEVSKRAFVIGRIDIGEYFYKIVHPEEFKANKYSGPIRRAKEEVKLLRNLGNEKNNK